MHYEGKCKECGTIIKDNDPEEAKAAYAAHFIIHHRPYINEHAKKRNTTSLGYAKWLASFSVREKKV